MKNSRTLEEKYNKLKAMLIAQRKKNLRQADTNDMKTSGKIVLNGDWSTYWVEGDTVVVNFLSKNTSLIKDAAVKTAIATIICDQLVRLGISQEAFGTIATNVKAVNFQFSIAKSGKSREQVKKILDTVIQSSLQV